MTGKLTTAGGTALDDFMANLSDADAANLQADLGAKDTPRMAQYRADTKAMEPYWKLPDQLWTQYTATRPLLRGMNYTDYKAQLTQAAARMGVSLSQLPAYQTLRDFDNLMATSKDLWLQRNPGVNAKLVKWGYLSSLRTPTAKALLRSMEATQ